MCYTRRKIEGGVGALQESDDRIFLKPHGRSRNLNIYDADIASIIKISDLLCVLWIILWKPFIFYPQN